MRNGETIFVNNGGGGIFYMWNSNGEVRFSDDYYKEQSVKAVVERAKEMYSTPLDTSGKDLATSRYNSRKDVISREGDSATNTGRRYHFNNEDWATDASGYSYDANRLYRKLIQLHDEDSAYIINKASKLFVECVDIFADKIKAVASRDDIDLDYFHGGSFGNIVSSGSDILRNCATAANRIKEIIKYRAESEEEYQSRFSNDSSNYSDYREYKSEEIADEFSKMMTCKRQLNNIVKGL